MPITLNNILASLTENSFISTRKKNALDTYKIFFWIILYITVKKLKFDIHTWTKHTKIVKFKIIKYQDFNKKCQKF